MQSRVQQIEPLRFTAPQTPDHSSPTVFQSYRPSQNAEFQARLGILSLLSAIRAFAKATYRPENRETEIKTAKQAETKLRPSVFSVSGSYALQVSAVRVLPSSGHFARVCIRRPASKDRPIKSHLGCATFDVRRSYLRCKAVLPSPAENGR